MLCVFGIFISSSLYFVCLLFFFLFDLGPKLLILLFVIYILNVSLFTLAGNYINANDLLASCLNILDSFFAKFTSFSPSRTHTHTYTFTHTDIVRSILWNYSSIYWSIQTFRIIDYLISFDRARKKRAKCLHTFICNALNECAGEKEKNYQQIAFQCISNPLTCRNLTHFMNASLLLLPLRFIVLLCVFFCSISKCV